MPTNIPNFSFPFIVVFCGTAICCTIFSASSGGFTEKDTETNKTNLTYNTWIIIATGSIGLVFTIMALIQLFNNK